MNDIKKIRAIIKEMIEEEGDDQHSVISPISPSIESPIQLSSETPPIHDPSWSPVNRIELSRAMSKIGEVVPDEDVGAFYEMVKNLFSETFGEEIG